MRTVYDSWWFLPLNVGHMSKKHFYISSSLVNVWKLTLHIHSHLLCVFSSCSYTFFWTFRCDLQSYIPLHLACVGGHTAVAGLLLSRSAEQLQCKDRKGRTSLHISAMNGHLAMVSQLLGQGADISATDKVCSLLLVIFQLVINDYCYHYCWEKQTNRRIWSACVVSRNI